MNKKDFPADNAFAAKPGEIAASTKLAMQLSALPPIDTKDPKQIAERVQWYFDFCEKTDQRPLVMGLCLCLNVTRPTLISWEREQTERGAIIRKAKGMIRYLLELWSTSGKLSPPIAIFWSKNVLGFSDQLTVEAKTGMEEVRPTMSKAEILRQIEEDIPLDDLDAEPARIEDNIL